MRYLLFFGIFVTVGCTQNFGQPDVPPEEEKARLKIFEMGGAAHRTKAPGYPVRDVYLLGCKDIDDDSLSIVTNFPHVRNLTLSYTKITDKGLRHLRGLKELRSVALCFTGISDAGLEELQQLGDLEDLNLLGTGITDRAVEKIKGFVKMKMLLLEGTKVTDDGLKRKGKKGQASFTTRLEREKGTGIFYDPINLKRCLSLITVCPFFLSSVGTPRVGALPPTFIGQVFARVNGRS